LTKIGPDIPIPIRLQRRGGRKLIMTPEGVAAPAPKPNRDTMLVKALVRAHRWRRKIESGQARSITDLAEQEAVTVAYVCRLLPLTCLAPDIVEAILDGRQPKRPRLTEMLGNGPLGWEEQEATWRLERRQLGRTPSTRIAPISISQERHICDNAVPAPSRRRQGYQGRAS
jgi:hypothetical protein